MLTDLPAGVQFLELTPEKVVALFEKFTTIRGLQDDYALHAGFPHFIARLRAPDSVWLEFDDGNGVIFFTNVVPALSAAGSFFFWDRHLKGREELTLHTVRWIMKAAGLIKVNSTIPSFAHSAKAFAERVGFTQEGLIRRISISNGKPFDAVIYGITAEEAFEDGTGLSELAHTTNSYEGTVSRADAVGAERR